MVKHLALSSLKRTRNDRYDTTRRRFQDLPLGGSGYLFKERLRETTKKYPEIEEVEIGPSAFLHLEDRTRTKMRQRSSATETQRLLSNQLDA